MQNLLIILALLILYWIETKYEKTWRRQMKIRIMLKKRPKTAPELSKMEVYVGDNTKSIYIMDPDGTIWMCVQNNMNK